MAYNLEHLQVQLIEDNSNMRALVKAMLNALGMENVHDYANGEQAMAALRDITPDLIITDWMMAPVDGLEYTKFIRDHIDSPDIFTPIILMTGHTERWRIIAARDAGVTELLAKPISAKTLYDRILAVIEKPRPFVRTKSFFGPCRRRVNWREYMGPERRHEADVLAPLMDFDAEAEQDAQKVDKLLATL
jgi:two-component system, chemotaxis family, chemotaxis protein CheY